ncbi:MAG: hypothetical protein M3R14_16195 [Acidobacteriota bacterium]|nr:hypothetical protein [Acidobacteriota bacterium]
MREVFIKNHSIKVALFLFVASLQISVHANQVSQLDALYRSQQYFELRDQLIIFTSLDKHKIVLAGKAEELKNAVI